jgi:hypothetical protein
MQYYCRECKKVFDSEEPRCPACMRKTTVVEKSKMHSAPTRATAGSVSLFRGPGLLVTIIILAPLMTLNWMEWRYGWWFTFVSALVGFGAGHAVNWFWQKRQQQKNK